MRLLLALSLLLASASVAALAPASAQMGPQYAVVLTVTPPEDALTHDAPEALVEGRVDFVGDPSMLLNLNGVPVTYHVVKAPQWAAVTISPANDVIPLTLSGATVVGSRAFTVTIIADDAAVSGTEIVEIVATVMPTAPGAPPKSAAQGIPVQYVATQQDKECPDHEHPEPAQYSLFAASEPAAAPAPVEEDDMTVQTGGATPVATWYAVGGFGLAGAAAGFVLLRRRKA